MLSLGLVRLSWAPSLSFGILRRLSSTGGGWRQRAISRLIAPISPDLAASGSGGGQGIEGPQPYFQPKPRNMAYNPKMYSGGLLPRLPHDDEPVKLPDYQPIDKWVPHRAYFGQNDYIDILGDETLKPEDFYTGPTWALRANNEFQRVCRLLFDPAAVSWLEEFEPSRLHTLRKRHKFLMKWVNKRRNVKFKHYRDYP